MDISPWIQWPILAAFMALVFFVGKYWMDQSKAAQAFTQELAEKSIAAYQAQLEAVAKITTAATAAIDQNTAALTELAKTVRMEHEQTRRQIDGLVP